LLISIRVVSRTGSINQGDSLLDLVLLAAFLVFNFFVLRWLARRLVTESAWLRDPDLRTKVLRRHGLGQLREFLVFRSWTSFSDNPIALLVGLSGLIYSVLWADYVTIREQWPWLLGG
jgi:hypothetical protein